MNSKTTRPEVVYTVDALGEAVAAYRRRGKTIGLVPTMGALHAGHLSLVEACKGECDVAVVTIYVNPSQFGPDEDLGRYPRTLEADLDALAGKDVELVFVPEQTEVYRPGHDTWVEVGSVAQPLEGACREGHFRGVATIVLKLLNMAGADVAYFGQKDFQQALVIRRMVEALDVPIEIRVCPIVREPDGLAMSSRNRYLDREARAESLVLWKSLCLAGDLFEGGQRNASIIIEQMRRLILSSKRAKIDYVALVDPDSLEPVEQLGRCTLAAVAVKIGDTRLIDNRLLQEES